MSLSHNTELSERVIGFAIDVHRHLGPGLLESSAPIAGGVFMRLAGRVQQAGEALEILPG